MPAKSSKIKVVDIDNNTLDAITEIVETPIVDTVESNIVESVETHDTEEINILPKPKPKAKSRAKPKEPVETEILNEVEEIKPKPKAKSRAKPKVKDDEFMDTEIEELPVKLKSKAKAKAKAQQEEEPEIIDPVKLKAAEKVECPDCKRKVTQKSLTYSHKFTCIAAKSKAFQKEKESEPIATETVNNEVSEDTLDTREFTPVDIVLPVKKPPPVSRLQMKQELKKERIKQLFVEAV
jgi:hypothetical protein